MDATKCPFCKTDLTFDMHAAQVCFGCGRSFGEMYQLAENERQEAIDREHEQAIKKEREHQKMKEETIANFLMSTGFNFEGYSIIKYLGIVHGECVLGTGVLSEFLASTSDFFGISSDAIKSKIWVAKQKAQKSMMMSAISKGANALIGIEFDISTIFDNMIVISSCATAVVIEKIE